MDERRGDADPTRSAAAPARRHILKRVAIRARARPPRWLLLGSFVEIHAVIGADRFAAQVHNPPMAKDSWLVSGLIPKN